jgi:AraC-like DNA-binding protein
LLRAIFDPQIGVALKSLHQKVEHHWTVKSLAVACGMSRSAFAVRFKDLVGETPLEYLTGWRMQKATGLLQKGDKKLFEVAKSVGYDSDAAFSKAFKRVFRVAPRVSPKCNRGVLNFTHRFVEWVQGSMARFRFAYPTGHRYGFECPSTTCVQCWKHTRQPAGRGCGTSMC